MLHRIEGIILRTVDYGEGNKIITVLTQAGKVGLMARGAKKVRSRLSAVTQLLTYGEFVFFKQSGGMGTLNHADIIEPYHRLREDIYLSAYASYLVEMVDRMLPEGEESQFLFEQLKSALKAMEEGRDSQIVVHIFEMTMLASAGYAPVLDVCVSCGTSDENMMFSSLMGGVLCPGCIHKDPQKIDISKHTRKLLRLFTGMDIRRLGNVTVKEETRKQLKGCIRSYMDTHVGIQWKARKVLDQLDKYDLKGIDKLPLDK